MSLAGAGWPLLAALGSAMGLPAAPPGDVDLAKSVRADAGPAWPARRVGEVLDAGRIERVILLKAMTSAMATHDLAMIRRRLAEAAAQPFLETLAPPAMLRHAGEDSVWEAVIVMDDGAVFGFSANGGRACLQAADGGRGCFTWAVPSP